MRKITKGVIHKSESDIDAHDNIATVKMWHVDERGWSDIGYHFFISKDGMVHRGRPLDRIGSHCYGHNHDSIGICLSGNKHFTLEQLVSLNWLQDEIEDVYGKLDWFGHCELDSRPEKADCPHVDKKWYKR